MSSLWRQLLTIEDDIMISNEEKEKIKKDIVEKINSVLEKNGESFRLDNVNVLNKKESEIGRAHV